MGGKSAVASRICRQLTVLLLTVSSTTAVAASFISFDPRSMAMGSSGVASARAYNAPLFNPALVTTAQNQRKATFGRLAMGFRVHDRDDFLGNVDQYKTNDNERAFRNALAHFNSQVRSGRLQLEDYTAILDSTDALLDDIQGLSHKPLRAGAGVVTTFGHAGEEFGGAVFARRVTAGGSIIRISEEDIAGINAMLDVLRTLEEAVRTETVPTDYVLPDPVEDFTSDAAVEAGDITEVGALFGWRPHGGPWRLGMSLKRVAFDSYDYVLPISEARGISFRWERHMRSEDFTNIDIGVAWEDGPWRLGLVGRNLRKRDIQTVLGNTIELRPQVRAGVAYETRAFLVTADLDLTRNEPLGFDPDTQFISIGGEMRLWENTAFRAGFRHNLVSGENAPSIGFGIGPPQAHADIAFIDWNGQSAFAIQVGFQF